jgi:protein SCO1/2
MTMFARILGRFRPPAILAGAAASLLLVLVSAATFALDVKVQAARTPIAPFTLQDQSGQPFTDASLKGHWTLIAIGFTSCPDVCPMTLANLALVLEVLSTKVSPAKLPQVVFLAVDPERDKAVLKQYVASFGADFVGTTGEPDQIASLVESLEGFYRIVPAATGSGREVQHSAIVSVVDPEGRLVAGLRPPLEPAGAAAFLADLIQRQPADRAHSP